MKLMRLALMALFTVGLMSCGGGSDDKPKADEQKPTVSIVKPISGYSAKAIEPLEVVVNLSDNVELSSYSITLKPASAASASLKGNPEFEWNSKVDLDSDGNALPKIPAGKKDFPVTFSMDISDAAAGDYLLTVEATDKSQNASTPATKSISVTR